MRTIKIILELWCELAGFRLHVEYRPLGARQLLKRFRGPRS